MIDATCPNCGRLIYCRDEWAGKIILCPGCGDRVRVANTDDNPSFAEEPVELSCPRCHASIRLFPKLVGRHVYCTACGAALSVTLTLREIETTTHVGTESASSASIPAQELVVEEPADVRQSNTRTAPPSLPQVEADAVPDHATEHVVEDNRADAGPVGTLQTGQAHALDGRTAPWFWPLVVASAATVAMVAMLFVITFAL